MEHLVSDMKSAVIAAIISLLISIPSIGVLLPGMFYYLAELNFAFSYILLFFFLFLYLLSPLLFYYLMPFFLAKNTSLFITARGLLVATLVVAMIVLIGFFLQNSTFKIWTEAYRNFRSDMDVIEYQLDSVKVYEAAHKIESIEHSQPSSEIRVSNNKTYKVNAITTRSVKDLISYVEADYDLISRKYSNDISVFLSFIKGAGAVYFLSLMAWVLNELKKSFKLLKDFSEKNSEYHSIRFRITLQQAVLLTLFLLIVPLISSADKVLEKPSDFVCLSNWSPTNYYLMNWHTEYKTQITHYGNDNTFALDSTDSLSPTDSGMYFFLEEDTVHVENGEVNVKLTMELSSSLSKKLDSLLCEISNSQRQFSSSFEKFHNGAISKGVID